MLFPLLACSGALGLRGLAHAGNVWPSPGQAAESYLASLNGYCVPRWHRAMPLLKASSARICCSPSSFLLVQSNRLKKKNALDIASNGLAVRKLVYLLQRGLLEFGYPTEKGNPQLLSPTVT